MRWPIDQTHAPGLRSWVASANDPTTDFPIQNLPYCVFQRGKDGRPCIGTAIGTQILDLDGCRRAGLLDEPALAADSLAPLIALPLDARAALRRRLSQILSEEVWRAHAE